MQSVLRWRRKIAITCGSAEMANKEGVQAAIEFVKYLLILTGGGIAFCLQPSFYGDNIGLKVISCFAVFFLGVSIVAGLFVHSRGCVMLSAGSHDLNDAHLKTPGLVLHVTLVIGYLFVIGGVFLKMW